MVAHYACDVLLLTGRPCRLPGVQALLRHLQPLPAGRMLSLDGYHASQWYPFARHGRIDTPKSTAAVGAMLCLLALDLRLGSFYFKAGDFQPYSTLRYLGMLDARQSLSDANIYYRDIDLDRRDFSLDARAFSLHGPLRLGFRQLDNERWPPRRCIACRLSMRSWRVGWPATRCCRCGCRLPTANGSNWRPPRWTTAKRCRCRTCS
ncbi:Uncharacterized protein conserved in bacteria, putative virulence factor [Serratia rubidaea]|uniref:Uncharacterized protein conserved in bacteria, putative virulence factor n=1 Tax=Serratia rubidaea TaxID=61652 RepID=A0A3S4JZ06_SERRU|nr:Uncharacterized protein conserved in bacteria, putative virulence factor [Serratia rubidaea]